MQNDSNLTDRATVTVLVKEAVALQNWRYLSNIGFYMISEIIGFIMVILVGYLFRI